jgi:DNA invertase Pin-like site-specific DNA recombinase
MIYIYCRVSSKSQEDNYSFSNQQKEGKAFAKSKGEDFLLFKDVQSGFDATRKNWIAFCEAIRNAKPTDTVWYESQDRLAREVLEFLLFKQICVKAGVQTFENVKKAYVDYSDAATDLSSTIIGATAAYTGKNIRTVSIKALKSSWDAGNRVHNKLYGYSALRHDAATH